LVYFPKFPTKQKGFSLSIDSDDLDVHLLLVCRLCFVCRLLEKLDLCLAAGASSIVSAERTESPAAFLRNQKREVMSLQVSSEMVAGIN
jgi:hypothetical protein